MFFCEFCEISKNGFFYRTTSVATFTQYNERIVSLIQESLKKKCRNAQTDTNKKINTLKRFLEGEYVQWQQCIVATRPEVVDKKFRIPAALDNKENCVSSSLKKRFSHKFRVPVLTIFYSFMYS